MSESYEKHLADFLQALNENRVVLPSFPQVAMKARQIAELEESTAEQLAVEVAKDSALAARILKVGNSSLFGQVNQTSSLQTAVTRLGLESTKSLVTNFALMQLMAPPRGAYGKMLKRIHQHSMLVASISYLLAKLSKKVNPNKAMMAGMLHDIGYLPIIGFFKQQDMAFFEHPHIKEDFKNLHVKVGHMLLMYWQFSNDLIDVVNFHEVVDKNFTDQLSLVDVVTCANCLAQVPGILKKESVAFEPLQCFHYFNFKSLENDQMEQLRKIYAFIAT